jgi:transcriptional regulator with XRE-family HTH domain
MKPVKQLRLSKVRRAAIGPWGDAVKRLRHAQGWTRGQAAQAARITPTTYGLVERGRHTRTSVLAAIAAAFGVPLEEVLMVPAEPAGLGAFENQLATLLAGVQGGRAAVLGTAPPVSAEAQAAAKPFVRAAGRYAQQQKAARRAAGSQRRRA